jgi:pyruvate-ferredoxin/flavodoxin oxidoreductase
VLPAGQAIAAIKTSIEKSYRRRGPEVIKRNHAAVDAAFAALHRIEHPGRVTAGRRVPPPVPEGAPEFVRTVTAAMMSGHGDDLPVSALPVDGTYPSGTTAYEKRNISDLVAAWDPDLCIQCGNCSFFCPHSVIRSKFCDADQLDDAPPGFASAPLDARGLPGSRYTLQVYVEDCTGCGLCVEACPVSAATEPGRKAINLAPAGPLVAPQRASIAFFESLPVNERSRVDFGTVRGTQFLQPLFEFSGACAGCGETPYLKGAVAAVRRPAHDREGDRLLVDLRREPAHQPPGPRTPRGGARPGPTPCSRTTPNSGSASGSPPTCT